MWGRSWTLVALVCGFSSTACCSARAHGLRTGYLEIAEGGEGEAILRLRLPIRAPGVEPYLPADCKLRPLAVAQETDSGPLQTLAIHCEQSLAGRTVGMSGLGPVISEAVVYYVSPAGDATSAFLNREQSFWKLPGGEPIPPLETCVRYLRLGLKHIAQGADHLMFVALLVLLLQRPRTVLLAEAAFTTSHTLSFAATTFGWVRLPVAATEACIALSLVFLALDVDIRNARRPPSLWASMWMALAFGLVHGLGFAGGLQEAGLPAAHAGVATLGFGLGVEFGQLAFSGVALAVLLLAKRTRKYSWLAYSASYGMGGIAMYWFLWRLQVVIL